MPPEVVQKSNGVHGCVGEASLDTVIIVPFASLELNKDRYAPCLRTRDQAAAAEPHAQQLVEQGCKFRLRSERRDSVLLVSCLHLPAICPRMGRCGSVGSKRIPGDYGKACLSSKESILELSTVVLLVIQVLGKLRQEDNCKFDLSKYL